MGFDFSKALQNTDNQNKPLKFNHNCIFEPRVYSFFIINNKSKLILARQFVRISKRQLLEHSSYFVRKIDLEENKDKNYFDLQDNKIRYLYQTLQNNNLYVVLVTSEQFNIFESLQLLKNIHRLVQDICSDQNSEENVVNKIKENYIDIIHSVDDLVNMLNGREEALVPKVKSNLKMESVEEKHFIIEQKIKEDKAKEKMITEMEEIERLRRDNMYYDNSVSNEVIENREKNKITIPRELVRMTGMNLKDLLLKRLNNSRGDEIQMSIYNINLDALALTCQNMLSTVVLNEIKRLDNDNDDEEDEIDNFVMSTSGLFMAPIRIMYQNNLEDEDDDDY
jgi:hypothetical protein